MPLYPDPTALLSGKATRGQHAPVAQRRYPETGVMA